MISDKKDNAPNIDEKELEELKAEFELTVHGFPKNYFKHPEEKYGITVKDDALMKRINEQMSNQHFIEKSDKLIEMLDENIKQELESKVNDILNTRHLCYFYGISYANPTNEEIKKIRYMLFYEKYLSKIPKEKMHQFNQEIKENKSK